MPSAICLTDSDVKLFDAYMTPEYAADGLIRRFFSHLSPSSRVLDAGCGTGVFLKAIPPDVPAAGIEIQPALAEVARTNTGRQVIVGAFETVDFPFRPTDILGNPPFRRATVQAFLDRADRELQEGGRMGFLLPTYIFSFSSSIERWRQRYSIRQEAVPRDLFPRIREPLSFFLFTRERVRKLWGFALFEEAAAVKRAPGFLRVAFTKGRLGRRTWAVVVDEAMKRLGDEADVQQLYTVIDPIRPTPNRFWRDSIRRELHEGDYLQVRLGRWKRARAREGPSADELAPELPFLAGIY